MPGLLRAGLPAPTSPACRRAPCSTATASSSTARRSGPPTATSPTGCSRWCAPIRRRKPRHAGITHAADRPEVARHHRAADPDHPRRFRVRRGVLRRRARAEGEHAGRAQRRLGGRQQAARLRALHHRPSAQRRGAVSNKARQVAEYSGAIRDPGVPAPPRDARDRSAGVLGVLPPCRKPARPRQGARFDGAGHQDRRRRARPAAPRNCWSMPRARSAPAPTTS